MSAGTAKVTVSRKHPEDVQDRQVVVSLDGERLATLLYGHEVTREVTPRAASPPRPQHPLLEDHRPRPRAGEHARFRAINRAGVGTFSMLGLLGVGPLFLTLEREDESEVTGTPSLE